MSFTPGLISIKPIVSVSVDIDEALTPTIDTGNKMEVFRKQVPFLKDTSFKPRDEQFRCPKGTVSYVAEEVVSKAIQSTKEKITKAMKLAHPVEAAKEIIKEELVWQLMQKSHLSLANCRKHAQERMDAEIERQLHCLGFPLDKQTAEVGF